MRKLPANWQFETHTGLTMLECQLEQCAAWWEVNARSTYPGVARGDAPPLTIARYNDMMVQRDKCLAKAAKVAAWRATKYPNGAP